MPNHKHERLSEDIKREISAQLRELKDPRLSGGMLTIVRTEVSGDNSHCKVFVSSYEGLEKAAAACKILEGAAGLIRHDLSIALGMKKCPELKFIPDNSIEQGAEITRILKDIGGES